MPAGDLVGGDSKTFADDSALEVGREEAVSRREHEPGRDGRPCLEGPRSLKGSVRLIGDVIPGFVDDLLVNVVEELLDRVKLPIGGATVTFCL